jgi:hypothetical protein
VLWRNLLPSWKWRQQDFPICWFSLPNVQDCIPGGISVCCHGNLKSQEGAFISVAYDFLSHYTCGITNHNLCSVPGSKQTKRHDSFLTSVLVGSGWSASHLDPFTTGESAPGTHGLGSWWIAQLAWMIMRSEKFDPTVTPLSSTP